MQIRTQQYLGTLIAALAILSITLMLFYSMEQANKAIERSNLASNIVAGGISRLRLVAFEYIVNRPERAKVQWKMRHESLTRMLNQNVFHEPDELALLAELKENHRSMKETFDSLVALDARRDSSPQAQALAQEVERRLVTQIMTMTQDSVMNGARLVRLTDLRSVEAQHRTTWVVIMLAGLIGLIVAINFYTAHRRILIPIEQLKQGAKAFSRGEFDYRTALTINNELGELSQAFDQMAARLAQTMRALEQKTALLQETNKELESFSYSVSHDLRAPLRGIDGWSLALIEDYGEQLDKTAHEYLERIRFDTQRMGSLIDDMLQLARVTRSELRREPVDLSALATSIGKRLRQARSGQHIEFTIAPGLHADGDLRLLDIALTNLLDNACKFSTTRTISHVVFGVTNTEVPGTGQRCEAFFVGDNGVGFDMGHAQRLFGAFQRMHSTTQFPGTGIGLATVQRVMARHGGRVWASSQPDQGAIFYFMLGPTGRAERGTQAPAETADKETS